MRLVDAINSAKTDKEKEVLRAERDGFLNGVTMGNRDSLIAGKLLIDADLEQISRGIDGPMCGGVLL